MMASQKTKFLLGLFVSSGIGLALVGVVWLGMAKYFEEGQYYTTYFNESVQGLDIDSPVKYRGVSIGRVDRIGVASDSRLIRVVMKIESGQALDNDMVAQLKSVGITGSMFIELDRRKRYEPDQSPTLSFTSEYPVVSSKPSSISTLLHGIDDVLNQLKALDLKGISVKIKLTLDNINQMVVDLNMKGISRNIQTSLKNAGRILDTKRWDKIMTSVEDAGKSMNEIMDKANKSANFLENTLARMNGIANEEEKTIKEGIENFRKAMGNANILMSEGSSLVNEADVSLSQLRHHLLVVTQNLEKASENLDRLIEIIADHPSQIVFGEPPTPRKLD